LPVVGEGDACAILIGQPIQEYGAIKREYDLLNHFAKIDPEHIVCPSLYYSDDGLQRELYVAPYIEHARCVYTGKCEPGWGVFVPEPEYRLEPFSDEASLAVQETMIALLVRYYDEENGRGIAGTQICGNDFILTKNWNPKSETAEEILPCMKLIAVRETAEMSLEQYLDLMREEFVVGTEMRESDANNPDMIINDWSSKPLLPETIERGIELGLRMRDDDKMKRGVGAAAIS